MKTLATIKSEQKILAATIRTLKNQRKSSPNGYVPRLSDNQEHYRAVHIVYCLLKGRTLEQIEGRSCFDGNDYLHIRLGWDIKKTWKEVTDSDFDEKLFGEPTVRLPKPERVSVDMTEAMLA